MSTPGSVHKDAGRGASYTSPAGQHAHSGETRPRRRRLFRWEGIIPLLLFVGLLTGGWIAFSDRILRATLQEAGTSLLGAQLDIAEADLALLDASLTLRGVALADPFDVNRNLLEIGEFRVGLEPLPLLERRIIVRQVGIADVRTGTQRETPAQPATGEGFAPRALNEVRRFAAQFNVPVLSLIPFDTIRAVALNPSQLKAVQAAGRVTTDADSIRGALEAQYASLRIRETIDSSAALVARLQNANVRTLGLTGTRRAVADLRAAVARVDSARGRVDALLANTRRGVDTLEARVAAIDAARREDYAFARGLLRLPSFEAPDIGASLFGPVTIERFQQAMYWATLAREHAPPGLLPRAKEGPKRLRRAGTTIEFVAHEQLPRFLVRRVDANVSVTDGTAAGEYRLAATDITSQPALVGRPTLFALRRVSGSAGDSLRVTGQLDHLGESPREIVNMVASGVTLPQLAIPSLPVTLDAGRGSSELRFALDGEQISGRWAMRSADLTWRRDSAGRPLNAVETVVMRALTGIDALDFAAEISGTIGAPRLSVRSNLDRVVADRLRAVVGEEVAALQAKVRAQVDSIVESHAAPVRARVAEVREEGERRVADARARLDDEKRKLEERLRALALGG